MIIYLAIFQSLKQHNIPAYSFWEYYIKNGIEEAGHTWVESQVDWAEAHTFAADEKNSIEAWKNRTWQTVLDDIDTIQQKTPIDIFLSYFYPTHIEEQAIKEIQKKGIKCVNFFCDHVRDFKSIPKEFKVFDLNWVPEHKALKMYKQANLPYINLPMPMWVKPEHRILTENENNAVSFIGSKDIQRVELFTELSKRFKDFKIYGAGWKEEHIGYELKINSTIDKLKNQYFFLKENGLHAFKNKILNLYLIKLDEALLAKHIMGKPNFEDYIYITKESAVTIGVNRYPSFQHPFYKPNTYSRLRDIEAPMLGACYLTEYTEGLENLYDIGNEIMVYHTVDELANQIAGLQKNKMLRKKLRVGGQKRALETHCIQYSIYKIQKYFA